MGLPWLFRDEHLLDGGLYAQGSLAEHFRTGGHRAQMHQLQPLALYLFNHHRENLLLRFLVFGQEHQSGAIFSFLGHRYALQQDELMGNLQHDARAVARLVARLGSPVLHVLQHAQRLVHQLVALAALDVHHHAHAARIVLVVGLVESVKLSFCHIYPCFVFFLVMIFAAKVIQKVIKPNTFATYFYLKITTN